MHVNAVGPQEAHRTSRRLTWMDLLRGTAVLLVMLNHTVNMAHIDGWPMPEWMLDVTRPFEPFRLPMLLLISGLFLPRALAKPVGTYVSGKLRNLAWPLFLWAPVTVLTHVPERAWDPQAYLGTSHLWYLLTLLFCYAVGLVAHKLGAGSKWFPMWVLPAASLLVLFVWLPDQVNFFWFGAFFFAGAALVPYVKRLQEAHWSVFAVLAGATAIGSWLHVAKITQGQSLLTFALAVAGCGAMVWLAPRIPRVALVRGLEAIGRRSIIYYVVHLPVIAALYNVLQPLGVPTEVAVGLAVVVSFVVPLLLTRVRGIDVLFSFPAGRRRPASDRATTSEDVPEPVASR
ncbi:acyltransferase [Tessaracoccus rhinocerotis]|uniref:Acyltransferase n=1 Tax=Tessaracoccus rhinocerotis TaxID=1689449 RepID=A0A553JWB9_9ACTN|nr:acyltransferase [Tessaracoccus rhinocerotis]TRY16745.1 acyltransferase [Tessaracoccus rhinocerotis]